MTNEEAEDVLLGVNIHPRALYLFQTIAYLLRAEKEKRLLDASIGVDGPYRTVSFRTLSEEM